MDRESLLWNRNLFLQTQTLGKYLSTYWRQANISIILVRFNAGTVGLLWGLDSNCHTISYPRKNLWKSPTESPYDAHFVCEWNSYLVKLAPCPRIVPLKTSQLIPNLLHHYFAADDAQHFTTSSSSSSNSSWCMWDNEGQKGRRLHDGYYHFTQLRHERLEKHIQS